MYDCFPAKNESNIDHYSHNRCASSSIISSSKINSPLALQMMKFIFLGNFVGMHGYSVPVEFSSDKDGGGALPIGMQLLGNHWQEHILIRSAHCIESGYFTSIKNSQRSPKPKFHIDLLAA